MDTTGFPESPKRGDEHQILDIASGCDYFTYRFNGRRWIQTGGGLFTYDMFRRFEKEILYDAHSLPTKFSRSEAIEELVEQDRTILLSLTDYLDKYHPKVEHSGLLEELEQAWCVLLKQLCEKFNLTNQPLGHDFKSWVSCTKRVYWHGQHIHHVRQPA